MSLSINQASHQHCEAAHRLEGKKDEMGLGEEQRNARVADLLPFSINTSTNRITNSGFSYDSNSNLTADSFHMLEYDAENRLTTSATAADLAVMRMTVTIPEWAQFNRSA